MDLLLVGDGRVLCPREKEEMTDRPFAKQGSLCLRLVASIRTRGGRSACPITVARQSRVRTGFPHQSARIKVEGGAAEGERGGGSAARRTNVR